MPAFQAIFFLCFSLSFFALPQTAQASIDSQDGGQESCNGDNFGDNFSTNFIFGLTNSLFPAILLNVPIRNRMGV